MDIFSVNVDLCKCMSKQSLLKYLGQQFCFPSYYGNNLDALDDCMMDLGWINSKEIHVKLCNCAKAKKNDTLKVIDIIADFNFWKNNNFNKKIVIFCDEKIRLHT